MNDKDKEAFDGWLENSTTTQEEIEAYEAMNEKDRVMFCMKYTWQAACEYMRSKSNPLDALSLYEKLEMERSENKKLREALEKIACNFSVDYRYDAREALKEVGEL
jgi:uncharacterized membrane protein